MKTAASFVESLKCVKLCVHADSAVVEDESQHQINLSVPDYSHDATRQNTTIDTLLDSLRRNMQQNHRKHINQLYFTRFLISGVL